MPKVVKRTFSLTEEQAKFIDEQVDAGRYATGSEVVRDGLRGMQEEDASVQRWLEEDVVPTLKKLEEDPSRARPLDEAIDELLAELESETKLQQRA